MRRVMLFSLTAALVSAAVLVVDLASSTRGAEAHDPDDFAFVEVITNLDRPTGVEVASNGDVFVIEKNGKLKVFNGFGDPTADIVANWESRTMSTGDQGMLGLAVDPQYGSGRDYVYVSTFSTRCRARTILLTGATTARWRRRTGVSSPHPSPASRWTRARTP